MDGAQFAKMLSDKHLFELKMSCIRLPFCTLLFAYYHPYFDGNGRTARLFHLWYLVQQGYPAALFTPFSRYIAENKDAYYKAYERVERNALISGYTDVTPFCSTSAMRSITACRWMQSRRKLILRYIKLLLRKEKSQKKNGCSGSMFCLLMVQRSLPQSSWKRISGNAAYATIRTFVMKFHEMGLLTARKSRKQGVLSCRWDF